MPTKLNVSDWDSRRADRLEISAGEVIVLTEKEQRRARKRASEVSRLLDAAASRSSERDRPAQGSPGDHRRGEALHTVRRRFGIELMGTRNAVSVAAKSRGVGMSSAVVFDRHSLVHPLAPSVIGQLIAWVRQKRLWWVHFNVPAGRLAGLPGVAAALRRVVKVGLTHSTQMSFAGPRDSTFWPLVDSLVAGASRQFVVVDIDLCSLGAARQGPARVVSSFEVPGLGGMCCSHRGHRRQRHNWRAPDRLGPANGELAELLAKAASQVAPERGRAGRGDDLARWSAAMLAASDTCQGERRVCVLRRAADNRAHPFSFSSTSQCGPWTVDTDYVGSPACRARARKVQNCTANWRGNGVVGSALQFARGPGIDLRGRRRGFSF